MRRVIPILSLVMLCALTLPACGSTAPQPTPSPVPMPTNSPVPPTQTATVVPPTPTLVPTTEPTTEPTDTPTPLPPVPTDTEVPVPTNTEVPTEVPPTPTPEFHSGGLGLTRTEWEKLHGQPDRQAGATQLNYENDRYIVNFFPLNNGTSEMDYRSWVILRQYGSDKMDVAKARTEAKTMLPADAQFIKTITEGGTGYPVDFYHSDSLATVFAPSSGADAVWQSSDPGTLTISYETDADTWILATGYDTPPAP